VPQPILTNGDLEKIRAIGDIKDNDFLTMTLDITWPAATARWAWKRRWNTCARAPKSSVHEGYNIIILSDRAVSAGPDPIPSLLATVLRFTIT
jgi:glutamate synthase (NADPH/NADH) large chain